MDIINLTDGWLVTWSKEGGRFKEWVRDLHLTALNHGWLYSLYRIPINWYHNICHVISWIPILWDDRDWDHVYLFIIMRRKIQMMRELHRRYIRKNLINQMKKTEVILTRLIEDEYGLKEYRAIRKKYPRPPMSEWKKVPGGIQMPRSSPAELKELRKNWKLGDATRNGDLKELGRIFLEEVRGWWD